MTDRGVPPHDSALVTDRDDPAAGRDGATHLPGRKWPPIPVHHRIRHGVLRFAGLADAVDGISGNVLSETLTDSEAQGPVQR